MTAFFASLCARTSHFLPVKVDTCWRSGPNGDLHFAIPIWILPPVGCLPPRNASGSRVVSPFWFYRPDLTQIPAMETFRCLTHPGPLRFRAPSINRRGLFYSGPDVVGPGCIQILLSPEPNVSRRAFGCCHLMRSGLASFINSTAGLVNLSFRFWGAVFKASVLLALTQAEPQA